MSKKMSFANRQSLKYMILEHGFGEEEKKLLEREHELAQRVYQQFYGKWQEAMSKLPESFFQTSDGFCVILATKKNDRVKVTLSVGKQLLLAAGDYYTSIGTLKSDELLYKEVQEFHDERTRCRQQKAAYEKDIMGILQSVTTFGALRKLWPQISDFIDRELPKVEVAPSKALSVVPKLNELLRLPPKVEA